MACAMLMMEEHINIIGITETKSMSDCQALNIKYVLQSIIIKPNSVIHQTLSTFNLLFILRLFI